jgi:hypothetical protein
MSFFKILCLGLFIALTSELALAVEFGPGAVKEIRQEKEIARSSEQKNSWTNLYTGVPLDLAIPILDAGIPSDPSTWEKKGIWPELRRAEAVWYAKNLSLALQETGIFRSVLVVPDTAVSADLYLLGEIKESNGEDLEIELRLFATTGKELIKKWKIKARVPEQWYVDPRTKDSYPFSGTYKVAANKIVSELIKIAKKDEKLRAKNDKYIQKKRYKKVKPETLEEVRIVRSALYGNALSEDEFAGVTKVKKGITSLAYIPDMEQDNWRRVDGIISADKKFNQLLDGSYNELTDNMGDSYMIWQRDAYPIAKAQREAREAANAALFGALVGAAVAGSLANNSNSTAGKVAAASLAVASVGALAKSFKEREESKQQAAQLNELGNSVSSVMSPKVISMENREVELTGTASEQQAQWSTLLKELYMEGMQDFDDLEIVATVN